MAEETGKLDNSNEDSESSGPLAGERLVAARREQKIPIVEIAKELHLDEYKVRALERNEFDVIGAPVFAKGHLRKYAQLVGVPEEDVMTDYHLIDRSHGAPPEISLRSRPRREISPGPWLAAIAAITVLGLAYWWLAGRTPAAEVAAPAIAPMQSDAESSADLPQTIGSSDALDVPEALDNEVSSEASNDAETVAATPAIPPPVVRISTEMRVSVTFSGDCWTEITDASGQRLFFRLGTAGDTINLSGEAPFNVLFGSAENVSLTVDGEPYEISSANLRGRTARLTITKP